MDFSNKLLESDFDEAYREELVEELLERLNVAYVAFTRARDQLYLMANQFNTKNYKLEDTALNKVIFGVLDHSGFEFHQEWDPGQWCWKIGSPQPKQGQVETTQLSKSNHLTLFSSTRYSDKVAIRPESKKFFMLFDQEKSAKIKEGVKVHSVLEKLHRKEDLDKVLSESLSSGVINNDELQQIKEKVEILFENPTFKNWFGPEWIILAERSIVHNGQVYRPDRVLLKDDEAVVIDFKREKRQAKYEKQVNQYGQLLTNMGIRSVKKYIVYIVDFSISEVQ